MDSGAIKSLSHVTLRAVVLAIISLFFTFIALVGLGAIAEDNHTAAVLVAHFAAKSLIVIFAFFAAKIPLLILVKWTAINGGISILLWHETINPKSIKTILTFNTESAYLNLDSSWADIFSPLTKIKKAPLEHQFKFYTNPLSMLIALTKIGMNFVLALIDSLPPYTQPHTPSFAPYRILKGLIILVTELLTIPLALIAPIINLPYYLAYFIAITIPDVITWLFFEFKLEEKNLDDSQQLSKAMPTNTMKYISRQLLEQNTHNE